MRYTITLGSASGRTLSYEERDLPLCHLKAQLEHSGDFFEGEVTNVVDDQWVGQSWAGSQRLPHSGGEENLALR